MKRFENEGRLREREQVIRWREEEEEEEEEWRV